MPAFVGHARRHIHTLNTIPTDILLQVIHQLALLESCGPPSSIFVSLLQTCKALASLESLLLYSIAFKGQFDSHAVERRLPSAAMTSSSLMIETKRRWKCLRRIRWASQDVSLWKSAYTLEQKREDMWTAFLMLLENDGRNWKQLTWAHLHTYVQAFVEWDLIPVSEGEELPPETEERALGLWLLWFLSDTESESKEIHHHPQLNRLIVPLAFAWYAYATNHTSPWYTFSSPRSLVLDDHHSPTPRILTPRPLYNRLSSFTTYFDQPINISLPLQSEAAHNLFFGKVAPLFHSRDSSSLSPTSAGERNWDSRLLDEVWSQLTTVPSSLTVSRVPTFTYSYVPGSFAGIYEGKFVFPTSFEDLAAGKPPMDVYEKSYLCYHQQTWKIQEHHRCSSTPSFGSTRATTNTAARDPVSVTSFEHIRPGSPLHAHLPIGVHIEHVTDGVVIWTPETGSENPVYYRTWRSEASETALLGAQGRDGRRLLSDDGGEDEFVEIVITGEALDPIRAPARATLMEAGSLAQGTIRKRDGLIVLSARSNVTSSGQFLYIGRVSPSGVWRGRWRALMDTPTSMVMEGIFEM